MVSICSLHRLKITDIVHAAAEIASLRKQAQAFRSVRQALRSKSEDMDAAAKAAFQKVGFSPVTPRALTRRKQVYDSDIRDAEWGSRPEIRRLAGQPGRTMRTAWTARLAAHHRRCACKHCRPMR